MKQTLAFLIAMTMLLSCSPNQVTPPTQDFELLPALQSIELNPGGETSLWIKLDRSEGFDGTVRMFLESLPAGVSQRWSRDTENGDCTLILSADEFVRPGTYPIDLLGEVEGASQAQSLKTQAGELSLVISPSTSLSVALQPAILNVPANSQTGMVVTLRTNSSSPATLSLSGAPTGVSASFGIPVVIQGFRIINLSLNVGSQTVLGSHDFSLQVSVDGTTRLTPISLNVTQEPANPNFKLTLSALSLKLNQTDSQGIRVFVTRIKGFNQAITLSLDTSESFRLTGISAQPVNLSATALQGSFTITSNNAKPASGTAFDTKVKGTAGTLVKQANLKITINPPPGSPDPSFSEDGLFDDFGGAHLALQLNDKILIAKTETGSNPKIIIKRLNVNGTLDTTFGTSGTATVDIPSPFKEVLVDVVVASDNKILLIASEDLNGTGSRNKVALIRLKANGQLDTSFASTGQQIFEVPTSDPVSFGGFGIQADGKLVLAVNEPALSANFLNTHGLLFRFLPDGSNLDTTFGTAGNVEIRNGDMGVILDVELQTDGKIVLIGIKSTLLVILGVENDPVVMRLLSSGIRDDTFSGNGVNQVGFGNLDEDFEQLAIDVSGRLVAAGTSGTSPAAVKMAMARFSTGGALDDDFAGDGKLERAVDALGIEPASIRGLVIQRDNKQVVLIKGSATLLLRQTSTGSLDSSFSTSGKKLLDSSLGLPKDLALDSLGRIIVLTENAVLRIVP